jgi:molecular chaperone DnaK (HSP70)
LIEEFANKVPYKIIETEKGFPKIEIKNKVYTPQEIVAFILQN